MSRQKEAKSDEISLEDPNVKAFMALTPESIAADADAFNCTRTQYPSSSLSRVVDSLIGYLIGLEKCRSVILKSIFLTNRAKSTFQRELNLVSSRHLTQKLQKHQISPGAAALSFMEIRAGLVKVFSRLKYETFSVEFDERRTAMNSAVQTMVKMHSSLSRSDSEFLETYAEFQKAKKVLTTQLCYVKDTMLPRRCDSILKKLNQLELMFRKMMQALQKKGEAVNNKAASCFNDMRVLVIHFKAVLMGKYLVANLCDLCVRVEKIKPDLKAKHRERAESQKKARNSDEYDSGYDYGEEEEADAEEAEANRDVVPQQMKTRASARGREVPVRDSSKTASDYDWESGNSLSQGEESMESEAEEEVEEQDGKEALEALVVMKKFILDLDFVESEGAILAAYPIDELQSVEHPAMDRVIGTFARTYCTLKPFLMSLSLAATGVKIFELKNNLEIMIISKKVNKPILRQLVIQLGKLQGTVHRFEVIEPILFAIREISSDSEIPASIQDLVKQLQDVVFPIGMILRMISSVNRFIMQTETQKRFELLSIVLPHFTRKIAIVPYEPLLFGKFESNAQFDNLIAQICQKIEDSGVNILLRSSGSFSVAHILIPSLTQKLKELKAALEPLQFPDMYKHFADDLLVKVMDANCFMAVERVLASMDGSQDAMTILRDIRRIHLLFLALDARKVIGYSNSVSLMYFRTFSELLLGTDILASQLLLVPIEEKIMEEIARNLHTRVESDEKNECLGYQLRIKAVDYIEDSSIYRALFEGDINGITVPVDISEMIVRSPPCEQKDISESEAYVLLSSIVEAEMPAHQGPNRVKALKHEYTRLLEMLERMDMVTVSVRIDEANFEVMFPGHDASLRVFNIQHFLEDLKHSLPPMNNTNFELYKLISQMKRGALSSDLVCELTTRYIALDDQDPECIDKLKKLNLLLVFLDLHDQITWCIKGGNALVLLRRINLSSFCTSMASRLMFLKSAGATCFGSVDHWDFLNFNRQLQGVANCADAFHGQLHTCLVKILGDPCQELSEDVGQQAENFLVPEDVLASQLVICTEGYLKTEVREFLVFLDNPNQRSCVPSGSPLVGPDVIHITLDANSEAPILVDRPQFPIPISLLELDDQKVYVAYLKKLQQEREELVQPELELRTYITETQKLEREYAQVSQQRETLVAQYVRLKSMILGAMRNGGLEGQDRHGSELQQTRPAAEVNAEIEIKQGKLAVFESVIVHLNDRLRNARVLQQKLYRLRQSAAIHKQQCDVEFEKADLANARSELTAWEAELALPGRPEREPNHDLLSASKALINECRQDIDKAMQQAEDLKKEADMLRDQLRVKMEQNSQRDDNDLYKLRKKAAEIRLALTKLKL